MYLPRMILAVVATACCACALAQNPPQPPEKMIAQMQAQAAQNQAAQMHNMVEQMGPMWEKMMEAMVSAQMRAAVKPEVPEAIATFKRNLYDALRKKGFTAQEAMQIVVTTPPPGAQATMK